MFGWQERGQRRVTGKNWVVLESQGEGLAACGQPDQQCYFANATAALG